MIIQGDARHIPLRDRTVQCVVTSPPYFGLRDYKTAKWEGGEVECDHLMPLPGGTQASGLWTGNSQEAIERKVEIRRQQYRDVCGKCGARSIDAQIGLEPTPDEYVATMLQVFREIRRVLKDDGTVWLNLGDSYGSGQRKTNHAQSVANGNERDLPCIERGKAGFDKQLIGVPWRVALALQADGWYLRSDIIWSKPNPMPESVRDRPTRSHEYIFLLAKSKSYYYDTVAIREPLAASSVGRYALANRRTGEAPSSGNYKAGAGRVLSRGQHADHLVVGGQSGERNKRTVWTIPTQPVRDAHFATFPEKLIEPCILAGTSEKGECIRCGENWIRQTEVSYIKAPGGSAGNGVQMANGDCYGYGKKMPALNKQVETLGWQPQCDCAVGTRPNLIFDPFLGSGTVGKVAIAHERHWAGLELNPAYIEIAKRRTVEPPRLTEFFDYVEGA